MIGAEAARAEEAARAARRAPRTPSPSEPPPPFPLWLVGAAALIAALALFKPLVIDEESYLWLGRHLDWENPYGWMRDWQGQQGWPFAHPPLFLWWMRLWSTVDSVAIARLSGLPWVGLWAWASAVWMRRACRHPEVAAVAWLGSATVLLGVQDTLMIDLPYVALSTAGFALYREGLATGAARWTWGAGLAMGCAVEMKYPAAFFVPVLVLHGLRWGFPFAFWGPLAGVVGAVEGWLHAQHGEWHPEAVWRSREAIARGPLPGRALGTLARAALLPTSAALLYTRPVHMAVGIGAASAAMWWARPAELEGNELPFLLVCAALGAAALSRAAESALSSPMRRRKGDRDDGILLGGMVIATFAGVIAAHNYASARYLLPAATPLAIMLARSAEEVAHGKRVQYAVSGLAGAVALALSLADWSFASASAAVAQQAVDSAEAQGFPHGFFAAEWTARATLEAAGWKRMLDVTAPASGEKVIVVGNSGGAVPATWEPLASFDAEGTFPVRVVDVRDGIGLYAETLGPLPFGVSGRPLETAVIYEVRP